MFELYLLHGRDDVNEALEDWGFDGPRLQGVIGTHQTYGDRLNVFFANRDAFNAAKALTDWETCDENALTMAWRDDCVMAKGKFYGDWGLMLPDTKSC
jgi:hypothetical protein